MPRKRFPSEQARLYARQIGAVKAVLDGSAPTQPVNNENDDVPLLVSNDLCGRTVKIDSETMHSRLRKMSG